MQKSVISRAEEQFAALQRKSPHILNEKETAELEKTQKVARLRALRLAKEAADREAAEADAKKSKSKPKAKAKAKPKPKIEAANGAVGGAVVKDDPLEIPPFLRREAN